MATTLITCGLLALGASSGQAQERVARTGSRLASDTTPRTIYRLDAPSETRRVLALLEEGRTEEAVALARDYLASLRSAITTNGPAISSERYSALNALCVALVKAGRTDEAIGACSDAIDLRASEWTALNSRATAYYVAGQYDLAVADYQRALDVAPGDEDVLEMLEHNIALAAARLAEAREAR